MSPQEAILAFANRQLAHHQLFRALLAHGDWRVPTPPRASRPTIIVNDAAMTPSIWAFSTEDAYRASCAQTGAEAIGPIARLTQLDDALVEDDPRVVRLTIDPASPIAFHIQTDELASFRKLAHGVRVERAMAARDYPAVRAFERYAVPYFGVLGQGHNLITLPSERGKMLAAFTAADAIDAFLAAGSEENRASVRFAIVDGDQLFGIVQDVAQGVLMNPMGPRTFGFELGTCREIANR
ncbi:MAG TPA: hypothetical protein VGH28_27625 [Polyangiaceae bacterium]|jgi:hypothetical protein